MDIVVKKEELLAELNKNREAHAEIFLEAVTGYRKKVLELLEEHIKEVRDGKILRIGINLPMPENHTKDYNRVIKMVEMNVGDEFELEEHEFAMYVMDDWDWKRAFLANNAMYSDTAMRLSQT